MLRTTLINKTDAVRYAGINNRLSTSDEEDGTKPENRLLLEDIYFSMIFQ